MNNAPGLKVLRIEQAEIICRMVEAFVQCARPEGITAEQAVALMPEIERAGWLRVSEAVHTYVNEQMEQAMLAPYPTTPGHLH